MRKLLSFFLLVFILSSCSNESSISSDVDDQINEFIWRGLNGYYLWQQDVDDLKDNRFANSGDLYDYFSRLNSPEAVFNSLLFRPGVIDRFSVIVDDYIALENSFQGISISNGMEFGLVRYGNNPSNVFGYVRYVLPNSDAETKGVTRGMIFNQINGTQLTDTNFGSLLFGNNTNYTIGLANYNNGDPVSNNSTITLSKLQLQENPVAITKVFTEGNKKIGYLLYNQFASSFDGELNTAFGVLKGQNIDELIVDLRYNGGGSVRTATYLGSMITGQFNGQLYSKEVWNAKVNNAFSPDNFTNFFTNTINNGSISQPINSLGLSKVHFIVSNNTASASELVINSLRAYIDVKLIGIKTVGKQVGSITLYDSESLFRDGKNLNPRHTYAMQPTVLEITNKDGNNEINGFTPGTTLSGVLLAEDFGNLGILGERSDPLLDRAIIYAATGTKGFFKAIDNSKNKEIYSTKLALPNANNMYVDAK